MSAVAGAGSVGAPSTRAYAFVAGGGTGGHVYPALAVAEELVRRGHPAESLRFVGARRGLEARAVPAAGFPIVLLAGRGLRRSVAPRAVLANIAALAAAAAGTLRVLRLVGRLRPRAVLGVGGYASVPAVVAALVRRVPLVVHEQNAAPGLVNRLAVRLGARAAVSLPGTPLRGAVLTGNPIRPAIAAVVREPVAPPLVGVFGGSLGAQRINGAALALYDLWRDRSDVAVHHVCGPRDHADCSARLAAARRSGDRLRYDLVAYEERMDRLYARATVVLCRAGAVTVAELCATGTPAVLVPLPGAPGDHQEANAAELVSVGAALRVADGELTAARLAAELDGVLADAGRRSAMATAARALARPDAAARVADLVEEAARG